MKALVPSLLFNFTHGWGNLLNELPTVRQSTACQDSELHLACPDGDVISISKVFYGRRDSTLCAAHPSEIQDRNCRSNPINQVQTRCNNKAACRLSIDSSVFDDPCSSTRKYLQVEFECVKHLFTYPEKYFTSESMKEFMPEKSKMSVWTSDPLSKYTEIYKLPFSQYTNMVQVYPNFEDFKAGKNSDTITLPIAATDSKFVVWDNFIYYMSSVGKKMIKFSIDERKQVSTLDLTEKILNSGLFGPVLDLSTSEVGIFGVYKTDNAFKVIQFKTTSRLLEIEEEFSIPIPRFSSSSNLNTLIIGSNFYIVQDKRIAYGINLLSRATFIVNGDPLIELDELEGKFMAYNPRSQTIQISGPEFVREITLKFMEKSELIQTTVQPTTEETTGQPKVVPEETIRKTAFCAELEQESIIWPKSTSDSIIRRNCPNGNGFALWNCDISGDWSPKTGPDLSDCTTTLPIVSTKPQVVEIDENWPSGIKDHFEKRDLTGVLNELEKEIGRQNNEEKIVKLVELVSRKLMNSIGSTSDHEFIKSLLNVFEQLHCWSLLDSESFLYLMANVDELSYVGNGTELRFFENGRLFQPIRCDLSIQYMVYAETKRQDYTLNENDVCSYFQQAKWTSCLSCDQCPEALFFKINQEKQSILFSPLYVSNLFSIVVIGALLLILLVSSSSSLLYPGELRTGLIICMLIGQLSLLVSPMFGAISPTVSAIRDAVLSLSIISQFQLVLCISHALHQRAKVVSSPDGVRVRTYMLLVTITSLLVVLATFVVFLICETGGTGKFSGWLHLGWSWACALLAPLTVSALFSFGWLIQSATISNSIRPHSLKVALFIFTSMLSSAALLSSFSAFGSKLLIEWTAALFMIFATILAVIAFFPNTEEFSEPIQGCLRRLALLPSQEKRGQTCQTPDGNESWLVADNRTSLAEFRYIPVVHNMHSHSYMKPRINCSVDRIYTEIVPNSTVYSPQTMQSIQYNSEKVRNNQSQFQMIPSWTTGQMADDILYKERRREDSGVHTANNSSDSERNSPVQLDDKDAENQSLLPEIEPATPVNI